MRLSETNLVLTALLAGAVLVGGTACTVNGGDGRGGNDGFDDDTGAGGFDDTGSGGLDDGCGLVNVDDASTCPTECDVAVEGDDGRLQCTVSCDPDAGDCAGAGLVCLELTDGGGACVVPCEDDADCAGDELCGADLLVCLPADTGTGAGGGGAGGGGQGGGGGEGGGGTDGLCELTNVAAEDPCDADCNAIVPGTSDDVVMCTTTCDADLQDCGDATLYCQEIEGGDSACFYDCSGVNVCPGDYVCDQEYLICVADAVSG